MTSNSLGGRRAAAGLVWLALFAILYTAGDRFGIWPQMPSGVLHDLDLYVGAAAVAALGASLWIRRRDIA